MPDDTLTTIGRAERVSLPEQQVEHIAARIDTGAKTSSVWATNIYVDTEERLHFTLLDSTHELSPGHEFIADEHTVTVVASSNGIAQQRYKVKLLVKLKGKNIRAWFTLADRSSQVYPVLIGRNVLRGKFIVDVKQGKPLRAQEKNRTEELMQAIKPERKSS